MQKGLIGGMVAGAAMGIAATMMMEKIPQRQKRRMMKSTNGVLKTVGKAVSGMTNMKSSK